MASVAAIAISEPGSELEFADVYAEHFAFVWRSLRRMGIPESKMDDAAQDVFVVVHRRLRDFEGRSQLRSWLYAIARRVAKDHRRRMSRKERRTTGIEELVADRDEGPDRALETAEAKEVLLRIVGGLSEKQRDVFVLVELEEMTVAEAAGCLDLNTKTAYSRLQAARKDFSRQVARLELAGGIR